MDSLPGSAERGLIAYGARESDAVENKEVSCQDIETLSPIQRIEKAALDAKIDELQPKVYTPMGGALRHAADELVTEGQAYHRVGFRRHGYLRAALGLRRGEGTC